METHISAQSVPHAQNCPSSTSSTVLLFSPMPSHLSFSLHIFLKHTCPFLVSHSSPKLCFYSVVVCSKSSQLIFFTRFIFGGHWTQDYSHSMGPSLRKTYPNLCEVTVGEQWLGGCPDHSHLPGTSSREDHTTVPYQAHPARKENTWSSILDPTLRIITRGVQEGGY